MSPWRTRIKFCGMTREQDIEAAVALGVDALGLILVEASPRALSLARAEALRREIPPLVSCVLLLRDPEPVWIDEVVQRLRPDLIQFHGSETPQVCCGVSRPYLKAIPMADPATGLAVLDAHIAAAGFVFDSHGVDGLGGSGKVFDWTRIPKPARARAVLAGGLTPDTVGAALCAVRPFAVDVSSGIESAPGIKDPQRMRDFVLAVRKAERSDPTQGAEQ